MDADLAETAAASDDSVEETIVRQEEINEMGSALLKLPEKQKDLLYFKYFLEMDNAEIAEILGIGTASVREYLTRARRNAKKMLAKEMDNQHEK